MKVIGAWLLSILGILLVIILRVYDACWEIFEFSLLANLIRGTFARNAHDLVAMYRNKLVHAAILL